MKPLSTVQRARFVQELKHLYQTDTTHQFLSQCVEGSRNIHQQWLSSEEHDTFQAYVQAEFVLQRHKEYLAYRLGLQHGREI